MSKIIKNTIQIIILLILASLCKYSGEITNLEFAYGILWCIITDCILNVKIEYTTTDENGTKRTKRIY